MKSLTQNFLKKILTYGIGRGAYIDILALTSQNNPLDKDLHRPVHLRLMSIPLLEKNT